MSLEEPRDENKSLTQAEEDRAEEGDDEEEMLKRAIALSLE